VSLAELSGYEGQQWGRRSRAFKWVVAVKVSTNVAPAAHLLRDSISFISLVSSSRACASKKLAAKSHCYACAWTLSGEDGGWRRLARGCTCTPNRINLFWQRVLMIRLDFVLAPPPRVKKVEAQVRIIHAAGIRHDKTFSFNIYRTR
jgi:hypothetical protein